VEQLLGVDVGVPGPGGYRFRRPTVDRPAPDASEQHALALLTEQVSFHERSPGLDLPRGAKSRPAVAPDLQERRIAGLGMALPCPAEGEIADLGAVEAIEAGIVEAERPFGPACLAQRVDDQGQVGVGSGSCRRRCGTARD
jgi:hypothetical protein